MRGIRTSSLLVSGVLVLVGLAGCGGDAYPGYGSKQDLIAWYEENWEKELIERWEEDGVTPELFCIDEGEKHKFVCNVDMDGFHQTLHVSYDPEKDAFVAQ